LVASTSAQKGDKRDVCVHVWDPASGVALRSYRGGVAAPRSLCTARGLLVAGQQGRPALHVWAPGADQLQQKLVTAESGSAVACSPDSRFCAVGTGKGKISLWEVASGRLMCSIESAHYRRISALRFTDDGAHLISASHDATVRVWRVSELFQRLHAAIPGAAVPWHTWSDHTLPVTDIHCGFGGLNARVVTSSKDCSCKVWDLASGELLCTFAFPSDVCAVSMDPAEEFVYAGCGDGKIYRATLRPKIQEGQALAPLAKVGSSDGGCFIGHALAVTCISVSFDGNLLVSGSDDGHVRVWDTGSLQCTCVYDHKGPVTCVALLPRAWAREHSEKEQMDPVGTTFQRRLHTPSAGLDMDVASCVDTKLQGLPATHEYDPAAALLRGSATEAHNEDTATLVGLGYTESASLSTPARSQPKASGNLATSDERKALQAEIGRLKAENVQWKEAAQALYTEATSTILSKIV